MDGAHLFDVVISDKILLFARSPPGMGAKDILTKVIFYCLWLCFTIIIIYIFFVHCSIICFLSLSMV